jgi:hypothetical protein
MAERSFISFYWAIKKILRFPKYYILRVGSFKEEKVIDKMDG